MRTRTTIWLTALSCAGGGWPQRSPPRPGRTGGAHGVTGARRAAPTTQRRGKLQERFLYVSTIAQSATDPDFIAVIGADPRRADFGKIVNRVDMPNVGDELHHYGYSADQKRLLVPGLFSTRIHVFDVKGDGKRLRLESGQRAAGREERLRRPARRHGDRPAAAPSSR